MREPYQTRFRELLCEGAAVQDIHDSPTSAGYAVTHTHVAEAWITRETRRVESHQAHLIPLLEHFVGAAPSILDVGCSTGGTTVALGLSRVLDAREVIGVDPNQRSIAAARVRAQGYGADNTRFVEIDVGVPLPFPDLQFHLTTCVSVLEFITSPKARAFLASELIRTTRPGGFIFITTPNPFRLREHHSRRLFGDFRPRNGYPWSSTPFQIRQMFRGLNGINIDRFVIREMANRFGFPRRLTIAPLSVLLCWILPWQKILFQKRETSETGSRVISGPAESSME